VVELRDEVSLGAGELVEGRPFSHPGETVCDAEVMRLMLARERALASTWQVSEAQGAWLSEQREEGRRHLLVIPDRARLLGALDVTVVGFFGQQRLGDDHAVVYTLERDVLEGFPTYAKVGLLSYYNLELAHGRFGNLILFWTSEVPAEWYRNHAHEQAIAIAPNHYHSVRLHRGNIPGRLLDGAELTIERTRYLAFDHDQTWRATRTFTPRA
jgi:hypothetical protein